jgi:hypothetical protein
MALLEENYFGDLGCEFEADKCNNDFNDSRPTSSSPGRLLDLFTLDKDSFNDYEQLKDRLDSTRTALDDTARQVRLTQLSVSLDISMSASAMEYLPRALTTSISYTDRLPTNTFNYSRHVSI